MVSFYICISWGQGCSLAILKLLVPSQYSSENVTELQLLKTLFLSILRTLGPHPTLYFISNLGRKQGGAKIVSHEPPSLLTKKKPESAHFMITGKINCWGQLNYVPKLLRSSWWMVWWDWKKIKLWASTTVEESCVIEWKAPERLLMDLRQIIKLVKN